MKVVTVTFGAGLVDQNAAAGRLTIGSSLKGAMIMMYYMHLKSDSVWFTVPMAFGLILAAGMLISMIGLFVGSPRVACTPELGKGCVAAAAK